MPRSIDKFLIFLLISSRLYNVFYSIIPDCDEVFNYYEPLNFITRGFGKQTWEYSPEYAIRSWAFLTPLALLINPLIIINKIVGFPPSTIFYSIRLILATLTIYSELRLYTSLKSINKQISNWYLFFSLVSTGYSHSSIALLPSSLAMNCFTISTSHLIQFFLKQGKSNNMIHALLITLALSIGGLIGWPFVLVLGLPSTLYILYQYRNNSVLLKRYIGWSVFFVSLTLVIIMEVDHFFYQKTTLVPLNIVLYNVINATDESGPDIFGVEPLSYYVINLLLNFNMLAVLAYLSIVLLPLGSLIFGIDKLTTNQVVVLVSSLGLWSGIFGSQPHKEERFLYPIYSQIVLLSSFILFYTLEIFIKIIPSNLQLIKKYVKLLLISTLVILIGGVSLLKTISLSQNYGAPLSVYNQLHHHVDEFESQQNVCLGREWYRFPSSFFLPDNMRLKFIESKFNGLLPGDFNEDVSIWESISSIPSNMNNLNKFDPSKLTNIDECDFIIDIDQPYDDDETGIDSNVFELVYSKEFLNNEQSKGIGRLIFLPDSLHVFFKTELIYHNYNLFKRKVKV